MPITEFPNHLCNVVVETGSEPLEYHCAEDAGELSQRVANAVQTSNSMVTFRDKSNHIIFVRARKVLAIETVYAHGG